MIFRPVRRIVTNFLYLQTAAAAMILIGASSSFAQSEFSGLLRNYNGLRINDGNEFIVGRNLVRTNFRNDAEQTRLYISGELLNTYTQQRDSLQFRLREAYVDFYFKQSELRIGKQIVSRGRANGAILTDILSPYDLSEFLTQDFADLRQGTFAVTYMSDVGPHQIDIVVNPVISESLLPAAGSTWDFRPDISLPIGLRYNDLNRSYSLADMQFSAQFRYRPTTWLNVDLSAQYWEYPLPTYGKSIRFDRLTPFIELQEMRQRSPMFGISGDATITSGLLATFEGTYYTRRIFDKKLPDLPNLPGGVLGGVLNPIIIALFQDRFNDDDMYTVEKPFTQLMAGLDYSSGSTFASLQGIVEYVPDHDGIVAQRRVNTNGSLLLRDSWLDDRLSAQVFARYGLVGQDYWVNPELTWKPVDQAAISVGAQLFGGPESDDVFNFSLSRYSENSFVFSKLTWNW
jgi:hypothetical protein